MIRELPNFRKRVTYNGSYKLVAIFVTLVLWITILGRKDIVTRRDFDLEFLPQPGYVITNEVPEKVTVKVSGPRMALKKFGQSERTVTLDVKALPAGVHNVRVTDRDINLPLGVKVLSIQPQVIKAHVEPQPVLPKSNEGDDSE